MTTQKPRSPIGSSATDAAKRRHDRSAAYRAEQDRLTPYHAIAKAVILGRGAKGLTQEQLALRVGTTGSAISRIESGTRPVTLQTLAKLGDALDVAFVIGAPRSAPGCVTVPSGALDVEQAIPPTMPRRVSRPAGVWASDDAPRAAASSNGRG